jgi:hypothetical protein
VYSVDVTNKREEMMAPGNGVNKYDWKYSDVLEDGKQRSMSGKKVKKEIM